MIDLLRKSLGAQPQPSLKRLAASEFLQHLILQSLYRHGAFKQLVFTGGTALRLLYHTGRYSEDLDFSLVEPGGFKFHTLLDKIRHDLTLQQLEVTVYLKEEKAVAKADLRFPGLLKRLNLSPLKEEKLTVKLEVDKHPPKGGKKEIALVISPVSYTVAVFDLASLFATKLHALFFRRYVKGRDYFDLVWFLGKRVIPNFNLLNNAIRQTEGKGHEVTEEQFKEKLLEHLESVDFKKMRTEMDRFVLNREESKPLSLEAVKSLLRNYR